MQLYAIMVLTIKAKIQGAFYRYASGDVRQNYDVGECRSRFLRNR